jgi:ATP/maltotriose-dependent transcriptional regulator MalT
MCNELWNARLSAPHQAVGASAPAGFGKTTLVSFVLDYLAQEVLQRQPAPIRSFLLQTGRNEVYGEAPKGSLAS